MSNLSFSYDGRYNVLDDVDIIHEKGVLGILGPNGSGKTTLLKILNGLLKPSRGEVFIDGKDIFSMKRKELSKVITLVPQDLDIVFDYDVIDVVLMGSLTRKLIPDESEREMARELLKRMGVSHLERRRIRSLSGGERRLVMLAKALFQGCSVVCIDELELHLDPKHRVEIGKTVEDISKNGKLVIAVFHDLNMALSVSDRIIGMKGGKIIFDLESQSELVPEALEDLYEVEFESFRSKGKWRVFPENIKTGWP